MQQTNNAKVPNANTQPLKETKIQYNTAIKDNDRGAKRKMNIDKVGPKG